MDPGRLEYNLQEYTAIRAIALAIKEFREIIAHTERGKDIFTVLGDIIKMSEEDLDEF